MTQLKPHTVLNNIQRARMSFLLEFLKRDPAEHYLQYGWDRSLRLEGYSHEEFRPHGWTFSQIEKTVDALSGAGLLELIPDEKGIVITITPKGMDTDHAES